MKKGTIESPVAACRRASYRDHNNKAIGTSDITLPLESTQRLSAKEKWQLCENAFMHIEDLQFQIHTLYTDVEVLKACFASTMRVVLALEVRVEELECQFGGHHD